MACRAYGRSLPCLIPEITFRCLTLSKENDILEIIKGTVVSRNGNVKNNQEK
jgi:hypothetical protein